jgi:hypothetical protein
MQMPRLHPPCRSAPENPRNARFKRLIVRCLLQFVVYYSG